MLKLTNKQRRATYDSTGGYCHLCHHKVYWTNYGKHGERGGWEVDHSVARANGGTDRLPNLRPACTSCNREKQAMTTRAYRARNDITCAPLSRVQRRAEAAVRGAIGLTLTLVACLGVVYLLAKRSASVPLKGS